MRLLIDMNLAPADWRDRLGDIKYDSLETCPISDSVLLTGCSGVPAELPPWIVMKTDLRALIGRLAPRVPPLDGEYWYCVACNHSSCWLNTAEKQRDPANHEPDCPWVEARRLLGDKL